MNIENIKISKFYIYCRSNIYEFSPPWFTILTTSKIGYRCSVRALKEFRAKKSEDRDIPEIITAVINNEIIWLSTEEFLEYRLKYGLKKADFERYGPSNIRDIKQSLKMKKSIQNLLDKHDSMMLKMKDIDLLNEDDSLIEKLNDIYDDLKALKDLNVSVIKDDDKIW